MLNSSRFTICRRGLEYQLASEAETQKLQQQFCDHHHFGIKTPCYYAELCDLNANKYNKHFIQ